MSEHTPFLTVFPGCADLGGYAGGLEKAYITEAQIDMAERTMTVRAWFAAMPSPVEQERLAHRLREDYGLNGVSLVPDYPRPKPASAPAVSAAAPGSTPPKGDVVYGCRRRDEQAAAKARRCYPLL